MSPTKTRTGTRRASAPAGEPFELAKEYSRVVTGLHRSRLLTYLPRCGTVGIIGMDGREHPLPDEEDLRHVVFHNKDLVEKKRRQGFTRLQLTPMAMSVPRLLERAGRSVLDHAASERLFQTKRKGAEPDVPARVSRDRPVWLWSVLGAALDSPRLVYFPQAYSEKHHGFIKKEIIDSTRFCAVSGWSVGLIEPLNFVPPPGRGQMTRRRRQLETGSAPEDYLRTLAKPIYEGETGWTPEDFLTYFILHLAAYDQVSHDRFDNNALWLLGTYLPETGRKGMNNLVPTGCWTRNPGQLQLTAHRTANRLEEWGARSMVRLGT